MASAGALPNASRPVSSSRALRRRFRASLSIERYGFGMVAGAQTINNCRIGCSDFPGVVSKELCVSGLRKFLWIIAVRVGRGGRVALACFRVALRRFACAHSAARSIILRACEST